MKKVLKVGCLSVLGFLGFILLLALFGVLPDPPEKTPTSPPSEKITSPVETEKGTTLPTAEPSPPKPKMLVWDKTPEEQGLKVGNWITINGYTGGLINAEAIGNNSKITGWRWQDNKYSANWIFIASQPTGLSAAADRFVNISGSLNQAFSESVARINTVYVDNWHDPKKVVVRLTGEISEISPPDSLNRHPGQWGMHLKSASVYLVE